MNVEFVQDELAGESHIIQDFHADCDAFVFEARSGSGAVSWYSDDVVADELEYLLVVFRNSQVSSVLFSGLISTSSY